MSGILTNRWVHFVLLLIILLTSVYYSGSHARWRLEMQSLVFDELNHFAPRPATGEVVIVNIDDDSLLEAGQWPWPRTVIADLVTNQTVLRRTSSRRRWKGEVNLMMR
jgi:CHASE2 domain-containing sensor protein